MTALHNGLSSSPLPLVRPRCAHGHAVVASHHQREKVINSAGSDRGYPCPALPTCTMGSTWNYNELQHTVMGCMHNRISCTIYSVILCFLIKQKWPLQDQNIFKFVLRTCQKTRTRRSTSNWNIIVHFTLDLIYDFDKDTWRAANRAGAALSTPGSFPQLFGHTLKICWTFYGWCCAVVLARRDSTTIVSTLLPLVHHCLCFKCPSVPHFLVWVYVFCSFSGY